MLEIDYLAIRRKKTKPHTPTPQLSSAEPGTFEQEYFVI